MITITTVLKTGSYYNYTWVDKMKRSLDKHMSIPFNFYPMSDSNHSYESNNFIQQNEGYWNKIELFRTGLYTGPTLYIDADNVVTGDLAPMIDKFKNSKFVMYRGRVTKKNPVAMPSSCVMYWNTDTSYLWNIWNSKPKDYWYKKYAGGRLGDQAFTRDYAKDMELLQDLYPEAKETFKFVGGDEPKDTSKYIMYIFAGRKKPHVASWKVIKDNWV